MSHRAPLSPRTRWVGGGIAVLAFAALVIYVVILPMRQTRFQIVEHELGSADGAAAIEGRVLNRGPAARSLLVEAYLYDSRGRYVRTARTMLDEVPAETEIPFRLRVDPSILSRVGRYSMYAGLQANPYAPEMQ